MDDVPAGPASPEPRRPSLSVVIPVRNGGHDFERCLRRLRDSHPTDYELIVIDDGSTDGSAELAESFGAIVVRNPATQGPAAARNTGARVATAPLVFFLDADVALHPETLGRVVARFEADPELSALFGSYDDAPTAPGLVSQFRNLLHHYVHQQGEFVAGARPARTFWTGCGAIRRRDFLDLGGFDPELYTRPAIEDIEFGYRLTRAGAEDPPGARRPGDPHEALDARRHGPDRHLPARRPLDDPDEAVGGRRDRPERQGRAEALRDDRRPGEPGCSGACPGSPGSWRRSSRAWRGSSA